MEEHHWLLKVAAGSDWKADSEKGQSHAACLSAHLSVMLIYPSNVDVRTVEPPQQPHPT